MLKIFLRTLPLVIAACAATSLRSFQGHRLALGDGKVICQAGDLHVAPSTVPHGGQGIFAAHYFRNGDEITRCPTLRDDVFSFGGILQSYYLTTNSSRVAQQGMLPLGYCAMANHDALNQNADFQFVNGDSEMVIVALKDIDKGQEVLINYGDDYWNARGWKPASAPPMEKLGIEAAMKADVPGRDICELDRASMSGDGAVLAGRTYAAGDLVDECPVLHDQKEAFSSGVFLSKCVQSNESRPLQQAFLPLGFCGLLRRESTNWNVRWAFTGPDAAKVSLIATRAITSSEELIADANAGCAPITTPAPETAATDAAAPGNLYFLTYAGR